MKHPPCISKFYFEQPVVFPGITIHEININSNNFNQNEYDIMKLNEKWFINLSSVNFPSEVQGL